MLISIMVGVVVGVALAAFVSNLATTIYLHRFLAHKAVDLATPIRFLCRLELWLFTGIRRSQWVAVHRRHHVRVDEPGDPHSPIQHGLWGVVLGNVGLYRRAARETETATYLREGDSDRWDRWFLDRAGLGMVVGYLLLVLVFGWVTGTVAWAVHGVTYLFLGGAVNGFGHHAGKRPYDNTATNLRWLAVLTAGEGMHNNHHHRPTSWRFGPAHLDLGGSVLRLLERLKLSRPRDVDRLAGVTQT
jgi:stearoyl-CoA desaturase (Delta-9 desaturase)